MDSKDPTRCRPPPAPGDHDIPLGSTRSRASPPTGDPRARAASLLMIALIVRSRYPIPAAPPGQPSIRSAPAFEIRSPHPRPWTRSLADRVEHLTRRETAPISQPKICPDRRAPRRPAVAATKPLLGSVARAHLKLRPTHSPYRPPRSRQHRSDYEAGLSRNPQALATVGEERPSRRVRRPALQGDPVHSKSPTQRAAVLPFPTRAAACSRTPPRTAPP